MLRILFLAITVAVISADPVKFKDCGNKEVISIDGTGCSGDICVLHKGQQVDFDVKWKSNQDSSKLSMKVIAIVHGRHFSLPGYDKNVCHHVKCPIKKGQVYEIKYVQTVPKEIPSLKAQLLVKVEGNHGLVACFKMNIQIKD